MEIAETEVEDVIVYFNEVCLDSEFLMSGDPSCVQKWISPVYYMLEDDYTEENLATLNTFTEQLNAM